MLKFLWRCQYNDGTVIEQTQEDVSTRDKKKSAFFDVVLDQVKLFWIGEQESSICLGALGSTEGRRNYLVDLTDGHFEINGVPFFYHEITIDGSKQLKNFRLIYKMRNMIDIMGNGDPKRYWMLGWQANYPSGENVQRILTIK